MSSTSDKISGKTKQAIGNITNNEKLEAKGKAEETIGNAKSNLKQSQDRITNGINGKK